MLRTAIRLKWIPYYVALLEYYFPRDIDSVVCKLEECQSILIPIFESKLKKPKNYNLEYTGDHWGIAVLHKSSAFLVLYDSIHGTQGFEHLIPHIILLANSIRSEYNFAGEEWPIQWTYNRQVYSVQRGNSYYYGIVMMLNAFHASRGIMRPEFIPGIHISNIYRPQLGLRLLENNCSSLL